MIIKTKINATANTKFKSALHFVSNILKPVSALSPQYATNLSNVLSLP